MGGGRRIVESDGKFLRECGVIVTEDFGMNGNFYQENYVVLDFLTTRLVINDTIRF